MRARSCADDNVDGAGNGVFRRCASTSALGVLLISCSLLALSASRAAAVAKPRPIASIPRSAIRADFAFYKNKTITMYVWGSTGTAPDLQARSIAPYLAAYLHCSVNVDDVSGGGTIPGQNISAAQPPNGLTIGELNPVGDIADFINNTPGLGFNLRAMPLLPTLPAASLVLAATPASGITSIQQLIDEKDPVTVIAEAGGSGVVYEQLFFGSYNIPNKFIYGYASGAAAIAGFSRGDAETAGQAFANFESLILTHRAIPLYQTNAPLQGQAGYAIMKNVPTIAQVATRYRPKNKSGEAELALLQKASALGTLFDVPVGTPEKFQSALSAAMIFAETRGGAIQTMIANGLASGTVSAKVEKDNISYLLNHQAQLKDYLAATGAAPIG